MQKTQETLVLSLDREDPLEEEMATHSSILAWKNPMDGGAWRATVHRVAELDTTEHADMLASNVAVQRGAGSIPVGGAKTPHASWPKIKK